MQNIHLNEAVLTWEPTGNEVPGAALVVPHPELHKHNNSASMTFGACNAHFRSAPKEKKLLLLYIAAWQAVIRDGVCPQNMHEALCAIPEFKETLAEDVPTPSQS
jgi:hypothetical protein